RSKDFTTTTPDSYRRSLLVQTVGLARSARTSSLSIRKRNSFRRRSSGSRLSSHKKAQIMCLYVPLCGYNQGHEPRASKSPTQNRVETADDANALDRPVH